MFYRIGLQLFTKRVSTFAPFCNVTIRKMATSEKFEKLPTFAKPTHYWLYLEPDLKTFKYNAKEVIDVEIVEPTKYLKLHSDEIEIERAAIKLADGHEWTNLTVQMDKRWKTLTVALPSELGPQKIKLSIDFIGEHNETMAGFYRSSYKTTNGETKWMVSTQFESESARKAFPCWDEPVYKARFDIEMAIDPSLIGLSNNQVISETTTESGKKLLKYATTPIMSSYLVAFAVGDFEYIESKTNGDVVVRVYTIPGKKNDAEYALKCATTCLDYFNEWFDFPYPLKKCDLISIPNFAMGAMENWGLVTFREVLILLNEHSSHAIRRQAAITISHELAHFWFGDLTTMKWWNDLWLKEGFASFMSYVFLGDKYPELNVWTSFLNDEISSAFALDSLRSSHPIEVPINDPSELSSIYDSITYDKSNSLLRMLYRYLGPAKFREGLRIYVKRFQYSNAVTTDLWAALSEASGEDVGKLMTSWTQQMGFPVVSVSEEKSGDKKRRLTLKQTRFLSDGTTDDTRWLIPITIFTKSGVSTKLLLTEREQTVELENVPEDDWIKLNSELSGFYRVQYTDEMLKRLMEAVSAGQLNELDRFNLANDLYALVKAGRVSAAQFLAFYAASTNEDEYVVWATLDGAIRAFLNTFEHNDRDLKKKLEKFVCSVLEPVSKRIRWEAQKGEDPHRSMLRALVLNSLAKAGHTETIKFALDKFDDYLKNGANIDPELRAPIFGVVAREREDGVEQLLKIFENGSAEVRRSSLLAIQQSNSKERREKNFEYALKENKVQSQDWYMLFVGCARGDKEQQEHAWEYFKKNHALLVKAYGGTSDSMFQHCFEFSCFNRANSKFLEEMESFCNSAFDAEKRKGFARVYEQTVEAIKLNEQLAKNHSSSVAEFLASR
ncbi:Aminopeptidase [Aphelenchoides besseyi]|nr:Aminopeptidase [Aphelenchoides besseyi]